MANLKILYVDDNEMQRELITFSLELQGYDVKTASNGQEGVQLALTWLPDLILMDLAMPVMDGLQASEELRAHSQTQQIPIIALTVISDDKMWARIKAAGMNGFIQKTTDMPSLSRAIQDYLSNHLG